MTRLFILLFCASYASVHAQISIMPTNTSEVYWNLASSPGTTQAVLKLSTADIPVASSSINEVITKQYGSGNTAVLSILAGSQNRLEVNQSSNQNVAEATLSGINNSLLLNQTGNGNIVSLGLTGTNNQYVLTQNGGDSVQMRGTQQTNTRLELTQGSGNNSFTVDNTSVLPGITGTGISNLRIEQTGGATAIIQNGRLIGN